jgi:hypothetical protein
MQVRALVFDQVVPIISIPPIPPIPIPPIPRSLPRSGVTDETVSFSVEVSVEMVWFEPCSTGMLEGGGRTVSTCSNRRSVI